MNTYAEVVVNTYAAQREGGTPMPSCVTVG